MYDIDDVNGFAADWEQRRYEIARQVLPECIEVVTKVLMAGGALMEKSMARQAAVNAVVYADELVRVLKGGEE